VTALLDLEMCAPNSLVLLPFDYTNIGCSIGDSNLSEWNAISRRDVISKFIISHCVIYSSTLATSFALRVFLNVRSLPS